MSDAPNERLEEPNQQELVKLDPDSGSHDVLPPEKIDPSLRSSGGIDPTFQEKLTAKYATGHRSIAPTLAGSDEQVAAQYAKLAPGQWYVNPQGDRQQKLWEMDAKNPEKSYHKIPEGEKYRTPEGDVLTKQEYEGISVWAQTKHDMATNEKERFNALATTYGKENVKHDPFGELYVDDGGIMRKPSHGNILPRAAAFAGSAAAPTAGAVGGAIVGGIAGTPFIPGAGTVAGGVAGTVEGSILGQGFNDALMAMFGVYDRSIPQELGNLALAGSFGALGEGAGIAARTAAPAMKIMANEGLGAVPKIFSSVMGATDKTAAAAALKEKYPWLRIDASKHLEGSPYVEKVSHFAKVFTGDAFTPSAEKLYEQEAGKLVASTGAKRTGSLLGASTKVESGEAGDRLIAKATADFEKSNQAIDQSSSELKTAMTEIREGEEKRNQALLQYHQDQHKQLSEASSGIINAGITKIREGVEKAVAAWKEGGNATKLMVQAGSGLSDLLHAAKQVASKMYEHADSFTGGKKFDVSELASDARNFLKDMGEPFQKNYPEMYRTLEAMGGKVDEATGTVLRPPTQLTFGQVRQMRSMLRHGIRYDDITPGTIEGSKKRLQGKIDDFIHREETTFKGASKGTAAADPVHARIEQAYAKLAQGKTGVPLSRIRQELADLDRGTVDAGLLRILQGKESSARLTQLSDPKAISAAEKAASFSPGGEPFHVLIMQPGKASAEGVDRTAAMQWRSAAKALDRADAFYAAEIPKFETEMFHGLIKGAKANMPIDAQEVAKMVFIPGHSESRSQLRKHLGENMWAQIENAHNEMLLRKNVNSRGEINSVGFAKDLWATHQNGTRELPDKLHKLVENIQVLEGELPIKHEAGDTLTTLINKAQAAKAQADHLAEVHPLKTLKEDVDRIEEENILSKQTNKQSAKAEPLGFLLKKKYEGSKAADTILKSDDLYAAAEIKYGRDSPEFKALQQVAAQRLLQVAGWELPGLREAWSKTVTDKWLRLTFPGVEGLDQAKTIAKNMEFLLGGTTTDVGGSMAAGSRVLHPKVYGDPALMKVPLIGNFLARKILGSFYQTMMWGLDQSWTLDLLAKGLKGSQADRDMVRQMWQAGIKSGLKAYGPVGAGAAEAYEQSPKIHPQDAKHYLKVRQHQEAVQ